MNSNLGESGGRRAAVGLTVLVLASAVLVSPTQAAAQACPAGRTCFYVPPAMVSPGGPSAAAVESEIWLSIASGTCSGTYRVDGGAETPFAITSAAALSVPLGSTAISSAVGVSEARGVFVVSSRPDLLVEHTESFAGSGYSEGYAETISRHQIALGTRFRLAGYAMERSSPLAFASTFQYVTVTAPAGATVTLTAPTGAALPYWTGSATATLTLAIGAGQSMVAAANQRLDGALATADAPIAVASGGRGWATGGPCGEGGSDALLPTDQYGTEFVVRLPTGSAATISTVTVIADSDATTVTANGVLAATLAAGARYSFEPAAATLLVTSAPALVWMNGAIGGCELDTALVPPLDIRAMPLSVTYNSLYTGEAMVVVPTAQLGSLTLDGASVTTTSSLAVFGAGGLTAVTFDVAAGLHAVHCDSGFQLLAAGANAGAGTAAYYQPFGVPCEETMVSCEELDGGVADAGLSDAGADDGGTLDGGAVDAGARDAGAVDASVTTDSGSMAADSGARGDAGRSASTEGGCGCSAASMAHVPRAWLAFGCLCLLLVRRRRRAHA